MPTRAEMAKIWAGAHEVGLSEDQLRDLVQQHSGQRSTRALSALQTRQLIDSLVKLGARPGTPARKASGKPARPDITALPTPAQRGRIAELRQEIGGDWLREEYFAGACRKRLAGKDHPATAGEAAKVIEMLKQRIRWQARRVAR